MSKRANFTVVAILTLIGVCLLWPGWLVVSEVVWKSRALGMNSRGAMIWLGLYGENAQKEQAGQNPIWPKESDRYRTSTEFFARTISQHWLDAFTTEDFGGQGLPKPSTTNLSDFTSDNNAWCVTINCDKETPPEVPFLFTRNFCSKPALAPGEAPTYGDALGQIVGLCAHTKPLGNRAAVVVTWGGSRKVFSGKSLARATKSGTFQKLFNPTGAALPFLHP